MINPADLQAEMEAAWLRYTKGTWSRSDKQIFSAGFRAGCQTVLKGVQHELDNWDEDQSRRTPAAGA